MPLFFHARHHIHFIHCLFVHKTKSASTSKSKLLCCCHEETHSLSSSHPSHLMFFQDFHRWVDSIMLECAWQNNYTNIPSEIGSPVHFVSNYSRRSFTFEALLCLRLIHMSAFSLGMYDSTKTALTGHWQAQESFNKREKRTKLPATNSLMLWKLKYLLFNISAPDFQHVHMCTNINWSREKKIVCSHKVFVVTAQCCVH